MHHDETFNFDSAKVCSPSIFETCFSYDKHIRIAATDYYMYYYIIVLFPLTAILQFINFTALSQSLFCFTTSVSHGVKNYFPRLWGMGISDAIVQFNLSL